MAPARRRTAVRESSVSLSADRDFRLDWEPVVAAEYGELLTPYFYATESLKLPDENFAYCYEPHVAGPVSDAPRVTFAATAAEMTCPCGCVAEVKRGRDCGGNEVTP